MEVGSHGCKAPPSHEVLMAEARKSLLAVSQHMLQVPPEGNGSPSSSKTIAALPS